MNRPAIFACLILAIASVAGCRPAASVPPPTSPVVGVITKVDSTGLNQVASFDLRTADGATYTFAIGELENPTEFPPGHLREHMATSSPVRVTFDVDGDRLLVTRLEDGD